MDPNEAIRKRKQYYMIRDRLTELLGKNYELLGKSSYYLTIKERWKILQSVLYQIGTEFEGEKIILYVRKEEESYIESLSQAINSFVKTEKEYNDQERYWEIKPIFEFENT